MLFRTESLRQKKEKKEKKKREMWTAQVYREWKGNSNIIWPNLQFGISLSTAGGSKKLEREYYRLSNEGFTPQSKRALWHFYSHTSFLSPLEGWNWNRCKNGLEVIVWL